jgi:hypothetical protein
VLKLPQLQRPNWPWLPPTTKLNAYAIFLHQMDEQRFWQTAWSEYCRRRTKLQKGYKANQSDVKEWQAIGEKLYRSMLDPQLFIELFFGLRMRHNNLTPPSLEEVSRSIDTLGLWFEEDFRPDAEAAFYNAGNQMSSLLDRYPDSTPDYWFKEKQSLFPAYFVLLYVGQPALLAPAVLKQAARQMHDLSVIRALDRFHGWPEDYWQRLLLAREQRQPHIQA